MAERKPDLLSRILISAYALFLVAIVAYKFFWIEPIGTIDAGLIFLIFSVIVLLLFEYFDSFSISKLLVMSRTIGQQEIQIEKLEERNGFLLQQTANLISVQNTIRNVSSNQFNIQTGAPNLSPQTDEAAKKEKKEELALDAQLALAIADESGKKDNSPDENREITFSRRRSISFEEFLERERAASEAYMKIEGIGDGDVQRNVAITDPTFSEISSSERGQSVDMFYRKNDKDVFVEFRHGLNRLAEIRIANLLSQINLYRKAKNVEARLDLVVINEAIPEYLKRRFSPAILSGLLRLRVIKVPDKPESEAE